MAIVDGKPGDGGGSEGTEQFAVSADNDQEDYLTEDATGDEQLAFDGDEERLPWLDSDDDEEAEASDGGRVLGLVVLGLIALATIVGGIWWSTHRTPDATLVADGSTIAAPSQAYKEAPKDPGGKTFDGTGNTAFAVSEGQTRPAKLGEGSAPAVAPPGGAAAIKPGFESVKPPVAAASAPPAANAPAGAAAAAGTVSGPAVQVGAYSTRASAEAAWSRLSQQYSALSGQRHQTVEGKADIGTVFRLQALPGDAAAAQALCGKLKSAGLACQVK
jgi:hypothetical protein